MPPDVRSPRKAAEGDRATAWRLVKLVIPSPAVTKEEVDLWLEEGTAPDGYAPSLDLAAKIAGEIAAERNRVTFEVASMLNRGEDLKKNDHVRVQDPHSSHYGKSGLVWFVRDGRVMVSMANPRSIGGSVSDSFLPEHLEHLEDPVPVNLERAVLLRFMRENAELTENLTSTQERCTKLLFATRSMRQKITELGGEDPGPP